MTDVNIWGDGKKELDTYKSKNYVGYIPSNYENYGFLIFVERNLCNGATYSAEEPYELDILGHSRYEFNIKCPDSVKMWKFSYKLSSTPTIRANIYNLKYILKGSNDNKINLDTFYTAIGNERIFTPVELNETPVRYYSIKSVFPNILIKNPKSYKYYIFSVNFNTLTSNEGCIGDFDTLKKLQLYLVHKCIL